MGDIPHVAAFEGLYIISSCIMHHYYCVPQCISDGRTFETAGRGREIVVTCMSMPNFFVP